MITPLHVSKRVSNVKIMTEPIKEISKRNPSLPQQLLISDMSLYYFASRSFQTFPKACIDTVGKYRHFYKIFLV